MNKNIGMILTFVAGIIVGTAATYKIAETKYRNIADEEIESVIDQFSNRKPIEFSNDGAIEVDMNNVKPVTSDCVEQSRPSKPARMSDYKRTVDRFAYDQVSKQTTKPPTGTQKVVEEVPEDAPADNPSIYIISPDEFNTLEGFGCETLYYSEDNCVLDSDYNILSDYDIKQKIDHDPFGHFGEYEDSTVHVRNEELMCDFEVLLCEKTAREIQMTEV